MKAVVYLDKTDVDAAIKSYVESAGMKSSGAVKIVADGDMELSTVTATMPVEIPKPA